MYPIKSPPGPPWAREPLVPKIKPVSDFSVQSSRVSLLSWSTTYRCQWLQLLPSSRARLATQSHKDFPNQKSTETCHIELTGLHFAVQVIMIVVHDIFDFLRVPGNILALRRRGVLLIRLGKRKDCHDRLGISKPIVRNSAEEVLVCCARLVALKSENATANNASLLTACYSTNFGGTHGPNYSRGIIQPSYLHRPRIWTYLRLGFDVNPSYLAVVALSPRKDRCQEQGSEASR